MRGTDRCTASVCPVPRDWGPLDHAEWHEQHAAVATRVIKACVPLAVLMLLLIPASQGASLVGLVALVVPGIWAAERTPSREDDLIAAKTLRMRWEKEMLS